MPTYAKEGCWGRCFDFSQDINWHGSHKQLWNKFKEKFPRYEKIENRELKETMDSFFKYCAKILVETEHGIVLDRIGYLALTVFEKPKKMVLFNKQLIPNYKAEGAVYRCYFFPVSKWKRVVFKGWMFSIQKTLKRKLKEKILGGMKYKNHIRFLDKNSKVIKS